MGTTASEILIELERVSKTYHEGEHDLLVLDSVSTRIRRGELVVMLGKSGSGKTTLLNLLAGIDLPDRGDVRVSGISLPALSERERTLFRRHHVGFVFQFFNLIPTLTVSENLLLPVELKSRVTAADRARAEELLSTVGLAGRGKSYPERLSGGERQRVAIARALMHDPDLLLADEPTGNLDLDTGLEIIALLDGLVRESGKTLVMATHGREVVGLADRVLTIHHGGLQDRTPSTAS